MSLSDWLPLFAVCLLGAVSPGPSCVLILRHAATHSVWHGVVASVSHASGIALYALVTVLGLSGIMLAMPLLFNGMVLIGAAFLFWLGIKSLLANRSKFDVEPALSQKVGLAKSGLEGFGIAVFNPKSLIFFSALFSQFITLGQGSWQTSSILVVTPWVVDAVWFVCLSCLVQKIRPWLLLSSTTLWINRLSGMVFILIAFNSFWSTFSKF